MRILIPCLEFIVACGCALGQTFEVASIKPAVPQTGLAGLIYQQRGGPGTADPGQVSYRNASVQRLLIIAYELRQPYQLSGPDSLDKPMYDIVAKLNPSTTHGDLLMMLRNLMAERFGVMAHHETKDLPIYELTVAKGGFKPKGGGIGITNRDKEGLPQVPPGPGSLVMLPMGNGGIRFSARQQTISELVHALESPLRRPVVDKTGLTGKYDFNLDFSPNVVRNAVEAAIPAGHASPSDFGASDLFTALQQQLGLKLEEKKGPVEVLVVDHAERVPTEN